MKAYFGPYRKGFCTYDLVDWLKYFRVSEDQIDSLSDWLDDSVVGKLVRVINDKFGTRTMKLQLHKYDSWNADNTIATIAVPLLIQLKSTKHGAPLVEDADVPVELRSTSCPASPEPYDVDGNHFKRWDWALDEMIYALSSIVDDRDGEINFVTNREAFMAREKRIANGLILFGKYFRNLWD